ncbi:Lace1 [Symbiodinium natans]|uniref:Lace1 protein n=1 Tax=Symbiodinium natans TaxID=878477 RepID=A0A812Q4M1_9DINO|nr:Lace1 [Symbiodinium natans]
MTLLLAVAPLLSEVESIAFQYGPCAFVSSEEYEFCCCEVSDSCWGHHTHYRWEECCANGIKERCPPSSQAFRRLQPRTEVARAGEKDTLAVYQFGEMRTTVLELINCEHQPAWKLLRLLLQDHQAATLHLTAPRDAELLSTAAELVWRYNLSTGGVRATATQNAISGTYAVEFLESVSRFGIGEHKRVHEPTELICLLGYASAAFVVSLVNQDRRLLRSALRLFSNNQDLDISSSSSWPISYWDLALNLGRGRPDYIRTLSAEALPSRLQEPLLYPGPWQDWHAWSPTEPKRFIHAVSMVYHPAADIEIPSFLLGLSSGQLRVTFAFLDVGSHYTGGRMLEHVCGQWPALCATPNAAVVFDKADTAPSADLLFCSLYSHCERLERWTGWRLPLISYYVGFPANDFFIRGGHRTVHEDWRRNWKPCGGMWVGTKGATCTRCCWSMPHTPPKFCMATRGGATPSTGPLPPTLLTPSMRPNRIGSSSRSPTLDLRRRAQSGCTTCFCPLLGKVPRQSSSSRIPS